MTEPFKAIDIITLNFLGLLFASTTLGGLSLITIFYYFSIQKSIYLKYVIYIFIALTLALVIDLYTTSVVLKEGLQKTPDIFLKLIYTLDLALIYLLHCAAGHSWYRLNIKFKIATLLFGFMILIQIYILPDWTHAIALYAVVLLTLSQYYHFSDRQRVSKSAFRLLTLIYTIITFYYFLIYGISSSIRFLLLPFEWIVILLGTYLQLVFTLLNYRALVQEKDTLNDKLIHDSLTGLYSKNYFLEYCKQLKEGWILFIDINNFKWINDNLGHTYGDMILKVFGESLEIFDNSRVLASRYGGDEFALLLIRYNDNEVKLIAQEVCDQFRCNIQYVVDKYNRDMNANSQAPDSIGISIGISTITTVHNGYDALETADQMMYIAKQKSNFSILFDDYKK